VPLDIDEEEFNPDGHVYISPTQLQRWYQKYSDDALNVAEGRKRWLQKLDQWTLYEGTVLQI
jgi:hypothetical protein